MTAVVRHTSVKADVSNLRDFIETVLYDCDLEERRKLLACVDRLEALATSTAKRSGVGTFIHIVKTRLTTDTHCGRSISHLNYTEAKADTDLTNPDLCKRCVQLYRQRQAKSQDPPTPAGSGSDSDMYPGASSSQSREPGAEPRQGEGDPSPEGESP